jgi:hypothetical protein
MTECEVGERQKREDESDLIVAFERDHLRKIAAI